ncbi:AMP-binding protein [Blastococcus sp. Marseille-P5729]|uniref:AMP-binding protein n=1 Tax=Blastococcus sp. Marseille-P5729 TaxID=2086582 RepID=UPI000D1043BD|nr:AMP-binding protein [Blastococcus sp. Marseille-P5729]
MYGKQHAEATPDKVAVIMAATGKTYTYREYEERANQAAQLFRQLGLQTGDTVALVLSNTDTYLFCKGGAERAGLRYVCINTHLQADELQYIVADSDAAVVVTDHTALDAIRELPERCLGVRHWLAVGGDPKNQFDGFDELVTGQPTKPIADERLGGGMLYSSGTTGRPKGIIRPIPDADPTDNLPVYEFTNAIFRLTPDMIYLSTAPLYHSAPHSALLGAIRLGATCVVMEKFDAEEFLALVEQHGVTTTQVVPTMLNRIMRLPREVREKYDISSLTTIVHGAAPMPPQLKRQIIDEWGPVLYEYYGATEGHGFCRCDSQEWLERPGTVGKAILGELVILDPEGNELPALPEGTIWFRGAVNFSYKGDPERTAEQQSADGSMATVDDVGYVDEDGYLFLTDRKSHMIISGGVNIYPQEIEDLLSMHPAVQDVAVIGVPDPDFGEQVKAVVIRSSSDQSDDDLERELIEHSREHLAHFKAPRSIDFVEQLPRTPTGKLQKKLLRSQYA